MLGLEQHGAVLDLHRVGADVLGARRANGLARCDVELALVQRTFDVLSLDEAVGEARLPVSAGVVRREDPAAQVVQANRLLAEIHEQGSVLGDVGGGRDFDPGLTHKGKIRLLGTRMLSKTQTFSRNFNLPPSTTSLSR